MKTSELIKILQEADPSGEAHVRLGGGVPIGAELKAGYWDGPYSYIDSDGKYVISAKGLKVDIHTVDKEDVIWDMNFNPWKESRESFKKKVHSMFKFEFEVYSFPEQRTEEYVKQIDKEAEEYMNCVISMEERFLKEVTEKFKSGVKFYQLESPEYEAFDWVLIQEDGKIEEGTTPSVSYPILHSGKFQMKNETVTIKNLKNEKLKDKKFHEWVLKMNPMN